jgi:hypothetical protein
MFLENIRFIGSISLQRLLINFVFRRSTASIKLWSQVAIKGLQLGVVVLSLNFYRILTHFLFNF